METNKYLNEETYQKNKKKITRVALIVLIVGILIGGSLIVTGLIKKSEIDSKYSDDNKTKMVEKISSEKKTITEQLVTEKQNLINSKTELENNIKPVEDEIKSLERENFTGFNDAYYAREDKIKELKKNIESDKNSISIIEDALDESFNDCAFDEAKNNTYTSNYCSLKNQLSSKDEELENLDSEFSDFNKIFDSHDNIPFYMFGAFIIIASCMISGSIYIFAKRREITAFTAQQVMPVAQEGIDKMAPTVGNAAGTIAKSIKDSLKDDK